MAPLQASLERFGEVVKAQRKFKDWSQDQLAETADISRPTVARIEAGKAVSTATLAKVAEALSIEVSVEVIS